MIYYNNYYSKPQIWLARFIVWLEGVIEASQNIRFERASKTASTQPPVKPIDRSGIISSGR
jgi:hypothetical protein